MLLSQKINTIVANRQRDISKPALLNKLLPLPHLHSSRVIMIVSLFLLYHLKDRIMEMQKIASAR